MQIEPSALYPLFDNLIVPPSSREKDEPKNEDKKKVHSGINMFFEQEPSPDENELLNKIIAAIGIQNSEIARHIDLPFEAVSEYVNATEGICILWGIDYQETEKYKVVNIESTKVIVCDKLGLIKADQAVKARLWNCLKEAFGR